MKRIFTIIALITAAILPSTAQNDANEHVYLIKGDHVVAKYNVEDVDYVSFHLPEGVKEQPVDVTVDNVGKNSITYTVSTISQQKAYVHVAVLESTIDIVLQQYYYTTLAEATPEQISDAIKEWMYYYAYMGTGNETYTMNDGFTDNYGDVTHIIAGQRYIVAVATLNADQTDIEDDIYYTTTTTLPADESTGTLKVTYTGLNERGKATFNFDMSSDIKWVHTMYGLKSVLQRFIETYGYDYTMFVFGQYYTPDELTADPYGWQVEEEDDYVIYALGIDSNGDWVKDGTEAHIVPPVKETNGPQISIISKEKGDGKVSVLFEITPSNVSEAYVRLMTENDVDDGINEGKTLAELAAGGDATNITSNINTTGEYTYTNDALTHNWYSLLIMGRNDEGANITRINFHSHQENADWDIDENMPVTSSAKPHAFAPATAVKTPVISRTASGNAQPKRTARGWK